MSQAWDTPDIAALLAQRARQIESVTTAANAGPFAVPLGAPLRPPPGFGGSPAATPSVDDALDAYDRAVNGKVKRSRKRP